MSLDGWTISNMEKAARSLSSSSIKKATLPKMVPKERCLIMRERSSYNSCLLKWS